MPYYALLLGLLVPILFVLITWVAVTAYRLYGPEELPLPLEPDHPQVRLELVEQGVAVRVGAREIRADLRYRERHTRAPSYRFERGRGDGLPPAWVQDIAHRCN